MKLFVLRNADGQFFTGFSGLNRTNVKPEFIDFAKIQEAMPILAIPQDDLQETIRDIEHFNIKVDPVQVG